MGRGRDNSEKKFRIGLRQGENEIVVKAVFGAGAESRRPSRLPAGGEMGPGRDGRRSAWRRLVHFPYHAGRGRRPDS